MNNLEEFRVWFRSLVKSEQSKVLKELQLEHQTDEIDFSGNIKSCPHCNCSHIIKHSNYKNVQRYKCKSCNRTFLPSTGTFMHHIKKKDKFIQYGKIIQQEGLLTIKTMSERLGISIPTAFDWRHKILLTIPDDKKKFESEVQADDLWFLYSQKGRKGLDYSRKRGGSSHKGDNDYQVKLVTASDKKQVVMKVAKIGRISANDIVNSIGNKFKKGNKLVTDKHSSYASFAKKSKIDHISFISKHHKAETGENVQYINNLASHLKTRINRNMRGVATKYLQLYTSFFAYTAKNVLDITKKEFTKNNCIWDTFTNIEEIYRRFIQHKSKRTYRCPTKRSWKAQNWNKHNVSELAYI